MLAEGEPGSAQVRETRWVPAKGRDRWPEAIAAAGNAAVVVQTNYDSPLRFSGLWRWAMLFPGMRTESRFTRVTGETRTDVGVTRLGAHCVGTPFEDERLVCTGFDGTRTRFAAIDPATGRLTALAWLPGRFAATTSGVDGWISGWWNSSAVAIRLGSHEAVRPVASPPEYVTHVAANDRLVATLSYGDAGSTLRIYANHQ